MATKNKPQYSFRTDVHPPQWPSATPTNPSPATNHPVFTDALYIREQVFVIEQGCSADGEKDEDDPRSWEWVVYATKHDDEKGKEIPVGVTRLVPPPHAPHDHLTNPDAAQTEGKFDYEHEPYVKITRVAILKKFRGYGLARLLMRAVEEWGQRNKGAIDAMYTAMVEGDVSGKHGGKGKGWKGLIGLHAQVQVESMYASLGYETDVSMGTWDEEGIEHVGMFKRVDVLET
jgi:predicted GNAT family N-acyltransferase